MTLSFEAIVAALTLVVQITALFYGYDRGNAERFRSKRFSFIMILIILTQSTDTAALMTESFCHSIAIGSEAILMALYRCWGFVKMIYLYEPAHF